MIGSREICASKSAKRGIGCRPKKRAASRLSGSRNGSHKSQEASAAAAKRQHRRQCRLRAGKIWLPIEPDEVSLVMFLIDAGLLHSWDAEDKAAIVKATERLIEIVTRENVKLPDGAC